MIVTSFQDFKLRGKQISQLFSHCELINSPKNGIKARFFIIKEENVGEICFPRSLI